jgi:hypothetical protein
MKGNNFINNSANYGGAIYFEFEGYTSNENNLFEGNSAFYGNEFASKPLFISSNVTYVNA